MPAADKLAAWPFPGDSPIVRSRRVALAYRERLSEVDPDACAQVDQRMLRMGQGWAVVRIQHFDLDDWVSAREAAELASVQVRQIAAWRRNGRLPGRPSGRSWQYQVRDVLGLSTGPRRRKSRQA